MMKISDLQSQIALNRAIIRYQEWQVRLVRIDIDTLKHQKTLDPADGAIDFYLARKYEVFKLFKKKIKQYTKLQRALKSEIAYRIQYNRAANAIEALARKNEGFVIVVEGE